MIKDINHHILRMYLDIFTEYVERDHNFLEVYSPDGKPYKSAFYKSDESMIWAAMYLDLLNSF